ncbi:MAG: hypothetical protein U0797_18965 [Gemmataceae bacterium]
MTKPPLPNPVVSRLPLGLYLAIFQTQPEPVFVSPTTISFPSGCKSSSPTSVLPPRDVTTMPSPSKVVSRVPLAL